jgi:hypothetical protein
MMSTDAAVGDSSMARQAREAATTPQFIAWTALAFLTTSSVASLRPAPTMEVYGLACVFLYLVPGIFFLIPTALVSAELASVPLPGVRVGDSR